LTETEKLLTDIFKKIINENKRHLNQSIEDFNIMLDTNPEAALQNLSMLSKEDQQTPPVIIEAMIDAAGWTKPLDKTKVYLDPCCGRGGILAYLHNHYNIPKENLYGIDIKQENVTLCTKLGFNVIKGDALDPQTYIRIKNEIQRIKGDLMEINRVLMNPPYDGNLHLKVLETTLTTVRQANPDCEIVSLQPVNKFEDIVAANGYKECARNKYYKVLDALSNLQLITRNTANSYFGISSRSNLGIYTFNTKGHYTLPKLYGETILKKVYSVDTLSNYLSKQRNTFSIPVVTNLLFEADGRTTDKLIVAADGPIAKRNYVDGDNHDGWAWCNRATTLQEQVVLQQYLTSPFVKRLIKLFNVNRGNEKFIPMPPLDRVYTTEEYCDLFGFDETEKETMLATDYLYLAPVIDTDLKED
jgi:hypothetical protein